MIALILPVLKIIAKCTIIYLCTTTAMVGLKLLKIKIPLDYSTGVDYDFKSNTLKFTGVIRTTLIDKLLDKYN